MPQPRAPLNDSDAWQEFADEQIRAKEASIAQFALVGSLCINIAVLPLLPLFGALNSSPVAISVFNISTIFTVWILSFTGRIGAKTVRRLMIAFLCWGVYFNCTHLTQVIDATTTKEVRQLAFAQMLLFNSLGLIVYPSLSNSWRWFVAVTLVAEAVACRNAERLLLSEAVVVCVTVCNTGIKVIVNRYLLTEIRLIYELNRRTLVEEQSRQEMTLELARRLQRSVLPEPIIQAGPLTVRTYQKMYFAVGGDWIAVRKLDNDRVVVVLVDATGKGFEAALVVHAIQSLWISSLRQPFSAGDWLQTVHETLLALGQTEPHTASIGLVEIGPEELTYWAAGHPPGFLVSSKAPDAPEPIVARGSIVGLDAEFRVGKKRVSLPADARIQVVFGTDGVLARDGIHGRLARAKFVTDLRTHGALALDSITINDDRSVVLIEREAMTTGEFATSKSRSA